MQPALSDGVQAPWATIRPVRKLGLLFFAAFVVAGCGSSHKSAAPTTAVAPPTTVAPPTAPATTTTAAGPSPLTPEAQAAATGDIPDNQVFLVYRDPKAG